MNLPLSWIFDENIIYPTFYKIQLGKTEWLHSGKVGDYDEFINGIRNYSLELNNEFNKIMLRGCSEKLFNKLEHYGFYKFLTGIEAELYLNSVQHFNKKSLLKLINRGNKKNTFEEVDFNEFSKLKFREFTNSLNYKYSKLPQLKYLFINHFLPDVRLFAAINVLNDWQAVIITSKNSPTKIHTEILMRKENAISGTMEAFIFYLFNKFRDEGFETFSLGEVPFFTRNFKQDTLNKITNIFGRNLSTIYNASGLYRFKAKFNPIWQPLYICSKPKLSIHDFYCIMKMTNFNSLLLKKLYVNLKQFMLKITSLNNSAQEHIQV